MGLFKDCGCGCNGRKQAGEVNHLYHFRSRTFSVIANPETFRLVRRVLGSWIATPTGCPSTLGLLVHTLVFILVVWGMMNIKKEGGGCPSKKKSGRGCGGAKEGKKVVVAPPVPMEEAPTQDPNLPSPLLRWSTVVVSSNPRLLIPKAPFSSNLIHAFSSQFG